METRYTSFPLPPPRRAAQQLYPNSDPEDASTTGARRSWSSSPLEIEFVVEVSRSSPSSSGSPSASAKHFRQHGWRRRRGGAGKGVAVQARSLTDPPHVRTHHLLHPPPSRNDNKKLARKETKRLHFPEHVVPTKGVLRGEHKVDHGELSFSPTLSPMPSPSVRPEAVALPPSSGILVPVAVGGEEEIAVALEETSIMEEAFMDTLTLGPNQQQVNPPSLCFSSPY